jgi:hypothetical protein
MTANKTDKAYLPEGSVEDHKCWIRIAGLEISHCPDFMNITEAYQLLNCNIWYFIASVLGWGLWSPADWGHQTVCSKSFIQPATLIIIMASHGILIQNCSLRYNTKVSVVNGLWAEWSRVEILIGVRVLSSSKHTDQLFTYCQPAIQWVLGVRIPKHTDQLCSYCQPAIQWVLGVRIPRKGSQWMQLATHLYLVLRLRMSGALLLILMCCTFMTRTALHLVFFRWTFVCEIFRAVLLSREMTLHTNIKMTLHTNIPKYVKYFLLWNLIGKMKSFLCYLKFVISYCKWVRVVMGAKL